MRRRAASQSVPDLQMADLIAATDPLAGTAFELVARQLPECISDGYLVFVLNRAAKPEVWTYYTPLLYMQFSLTVYIVVSDLVTCIHSCLTVSGTLWSYCRCSQDAYHVLNASGMCS